MRTVLSYLVAAHRCEISELERLSRTCELVRAISELVHHLQHERGVSNIFLASAGRCYGEQRAERLISTDAAESEVRAWLGQIDLGESMAGGARLYTSLAIALHALGELPQIREAVGQQGCSPGQSTRRYQRIVAALLALVFEAADIATDPTVSRLLVALFNLMQGKEFAGQERACGAAAFAAGHIAAGEIASMQSLIDSQEQSFERFESLCEGDIRQQWQALQATMPLAEIERMRRKLMVPGSHLEVAMADDWFAQCSRRMDELHRAESHLATVLQQVSAAKVAKMRQELEDQQTMLAALTPADGVPPSALLAPVLGALNGEAPLSAGDGMGPRLSRTIIDVLQTQSRHLQAVSDELAAVRAALDERKLIERAKGLLMAHQGLGEEEAYRLLRQKAMNQNRRIVDVAEAVLSMADFLPARG